MAKATQERCLWAWRRFLGFLAIYESTALEIAPNERLTAERVRALVSHLAETNAPRSVVSHVDALYLGARVMMPEHDWSWLKAIKARLRAAAPTQSQARPVITSVQLLDIGQQLMDENKPEPGAPISMHGAIHYRDGLMLALLAFIPIRRKNLAALEIGRHIVLQGNRWSVIIPREETKTGAPIEFLVPELLVSYLSFYLDVVRPRILRRTTCAALWISRVRGSALSHVGIQKTFGRLSDQIGFHITPHDARDAAATTWAISAPDQIGIARDLLAHSDLRTTTRHYNRARGIEASRAYHQVTAGLRTKRPFRRS